MKNNKQYVIIKRFYDNNGILRFLEPTIFTEENTKTYYLNPQFFSKKYYGNNFVLINDRGTTIITPKNNIITLYKHIKSLCNEYVNDKNKQIKITENNLKLYQLRDGYDVYPTKFYQIRLKQLYTHTQETLEE